MNQQPFETIFEFTVKKRLAALQCGQPEGSHRSPFPRLPLPWQTKTFKISVMAHEDVGRHHDEEVPNLGASDEHDPSRELPHCGSDTRSVQEAPTRQGKNYKLAQMCLS